MWVLTVRVQMFRNRVIDLYDVIIFGKSKHHNYKGEFSLSNSKNIEKKRDSKHKNLRYIFLS